MIPTAFPYTLVLASGSPRRRALIEKMMLPFRIDKVDVEEVYPEGMSPEEVVLFLSALKSEAYSGLKPDELLVTADTLVSLGGTIIEKPADADDAKRMLKMLSGKVHDVFSGVALRKGTEQRLLYEQTRVFFRELSAAEIAYYVEAFQPFDKAGAYGVQEWIGMVGVEKMEGDFYNVMGLPVQRLYAELKKWLKDEAL